VPPTRSQAKTFPVIGTTPKRFICAPGLESPQPTMSAFTTGHAPTYGRSAPAQIAATSAVQRADHAA
jgi:hypothetical protein